MTNDASIRSDDSTHSADARVFTIAAMLLIVGLHAVRPFVPQVVNIFLVGLTLLITLYSAFRGWKNVVHLGLLYVIIGVSWLIPVVLDFHWSPYPPALAGYLLIVFLIKPLRQSADWLRRGALTQNTILWIIAVIAVSTAGLVTWYLWARPDVDAITQLLPGSNAVVIVAAVFGFAVVNAIVEEFIFDGVCYHAFETVIAVPLVVIFLQAFSYGMAHYTGIPRGWLGVVMAVAYGGLMLGYLRYRTGGILYPIIAHVFADITIGLLVFFA
jgi:uncharacterized protein